MAGRPNAADGGLHPAGIDPPAGIETVTRGCTGYPPILADTPGAPMRLYVTGGRERLARLAAEPIVAIVGSRRPTDYGMEIARSLARGLAAARVTVVSEFANGIGAAAHAGALEVDGPTLTVMAGGIDVIEPAGRRALYERVIATGCALATAPCGIKQHRWSAIARARTIAALATLTLVVEAEDNPSELRIARFARALDRAVSAVPGRVTSPTSRGTNALLAQGASLVRGPADALDCLYGLHAPSAGVRRSPGASGPARTSSPLAGLRPILRTTLERVGAGEDTPAKLTRAVDDPGETLLALAELELLGLLGRGDGGRYVPRQNA